MLMWETIYTLKSWLEITFNQKADAECGALKSKKDKEIESGKSLWGLEQRNVSRDERDYKKLPYINASQATWLLNDPGNPSDNNNGERKPLPTSCLLMPHCSPHYTI